MLDKIVGLFTGKTVEKGLDIGANIVDGIKEGLDNWNLSDEEKIQYMQGGFKLQLKFMEQNVEQNSLRSQARREIAKNIVNFQLAMIAFMALIWKYDPKWAEYLLKLNVETKLGLAFIAVIVFYFGYYGVQGMIAKAKKN